MKVKDTAIFEKRYLVNLKVYHVHSVYYIDGSNYVADDIDILHISLRITSIRYGTG